MSRVFNSGYEGELYKLTNCNRHLRYFSIDSFTSTLHYYSATQMKNSNSIKTPMGSFQLHNCMIFADVNSPVSFTITDCSYRQKSWVLIARSRRDRTAWLNALKFEKYKLKREKLEYVSNTEKVGQGVSNSWNYVVWIIIFYISLFICFILSNIWQFLNDFILIYIK